MTAPDKSAVVRRIVVEGLVQGVGYREFTLRTALRLNVSGWVRNRSDGAVEALIRGGPGAVEALIAEMRVGPGMAIVDNLSVIEHAEADAESDGSFVIRSTR
jgi:acylphosphatase